MLVPKSVYFPLWWQNMDFQNIQNFFFKMLIVSKFHSDFFILCDQYYITDDSRNMGASNWRFLLLNITKYRKLQQFETHISLELLELWNYSKYKSNCRILKGWHDLKIQILTPWLEFHLNRVIHPSYHASNLIHNIWMQ